MQSKLKLNLENLSVDSFDTVGVEKRKGTIFGEQCTCYTQCTCPGGPSDDCQPSVGDTCQNSCVGTCQCHTFMSECDCAGTCMETACGGSPCCR